jgi:hypothetical protein
MLAAVLIGGAVAALVVGVWIGLGAPGWPRAPERNRRHTEKRPLNPVAWGRTAGRERLRPRTPEERRPRLR